MIWTIFHTYAGLLPGYPWGFPDFPYKQFLPHLQLVLFLTLMELNKANVEVKKAEMELKKAEMELRKAKMELRKAKMELKKAKRNLLDIRKAQRELRELERNFRQSDIVWEVKNDPLLKMAEDECIEILKSKMNID